MVTKVEKSRVRKAVTEVVLHTKNEFDEPLPKNHYYVTGGEEDHYVHTVPFWECDCGDWTWRTGFICKHLLAALLYEENNLILRAVRQMGYDKSEYTIRAPSQQKREV